ncbi:MAG: endo alpha-1,4 polygalactosaminidase [Hyphomicrobiaceae bacterium]
MQPGSGTDVRGGRSILKRAIVGIVLLAAIAGGGAWLMDASIDKTEETAAAGDGRVRLAGVTSWGYQLQRLDVASAAAAPIDLIVVDHSVAERGEDSSVLERLKRKADGSRRTVLAYVSIGEAEDYRRYWRKEWAAPAPLRGARPLLTSLTTGGSAVRTHARPLAADTARPPLVPTAAAPAWLGDENAEWRGNFRVRFWHPDWKTLVFGQADSAIDRAVAAGFDGVYLDRADVYGLWRREQPSARADMIDLVSGLAAHARRQKPGFMVVMQNAEELLTSRELRRTLDGVAKEDLLFGIDGEGRQNAAADIDASLKYLRVARKDGLPVLVIEYVAEPMARESIRKRLAGEGFVASFGPRMLDSLSSVR